MYTQFMQKGFAFLAIFFGVILPLFVVQSAESEELLYGYDAAHRLTEVQYDSDTTVTRIFDALGNRLIKNTITGSPENAPPFTPALLIPENNSSIPSSNQQLSWSGGDPDDGDIVFYDVYLGTSSNPPLYASGITVTSLPLRPLNPSNTYYWKIVATDSYNESSESVVQEFTTTNSAPTVPSGLLPGEGTIVDGEALTLRWDFSTDADLSDNVVYDLYFGTTEDPPLFREGIAYNAYPVGTLNSTEPYYWKVVARDSSGGATSSGLYSFSLTPADHRLSSLTLSQDTEFLSGSVPYIVSGNLTVPAGMSLTIPAGTILKFKTGASLSVYGTLKVLGSSENQVYFTSIHNDSVGGDTNSNRDLTSPAPGNWYGLRFYNTASDSENILEHCIVEYAGYGNLGAIFIDQSSPTIKSTIVRNSLNYGIQVYRGGSPVISDCEISDNKSYGIYVRYGSPTPTITGCVLTGNYYGLYTEAGRTMFSGNEISENSQWGVFINGGTASLRG